MIESGGVSVNGMPFGRILSFGEILDGSLRLLKQNLRVFWLIAFAVNTLPGLLLEWWYSREVRMVNGVPTLSPDQEFWYYFAEVLLWGSVVFPLLMNAAATLFGQGNVQFRSAFVGGWKVLAANGLLMLLHVVLFALVVLIVGVPVYFVAEPQNPAESSDALAIAMWVCAFVYLIPGLWLFTRLSLVIPALKGEKISVWRSFSRSWELTRGLFWTVSGGWLTLVLLSVPLLAIVMVALDGLSSLFPQQKLWTMVTGSAILSFILKPFLLPWIPLFLTLLYWNQRIRREGIDLEEQITRVS
jgi:hypothetical protein